MAKKERTQKKTTGIVESVRLERRNRNVMVVTFVDGDTSTIVIPPGDDRCDIIAEKDVVAGHYHYGFSGLVVMTSGGKRSVFLEGRKIYECNYR